MANQKQYFSVIALIAVCAFVVISGCINTGPADSGSQTNNVAIATTPIPTATVAVAKTTVATLQPTTVVTTVPTTVPETVVTTTSEKTVVPTSASDVKIVGQSSETIGSGKFQHFVTIQNNLNAKVATRMVFGSGQKADVLCVVERVEIPAKGSVKIALPGVVDANSGEISYLMILAMSKPKVAS